MYCLTIQFVDKMNLLYRWCRDSPAIIEFLFNFEREKSYYILIEVARCIDDSTINTVSLRLDEKEIQHNVKWIWWRRRYQLKAKVEENTLNSDKKLHRLEILSHMKNEHKLPGARKLSVAIGEIKVVRI